MSKTRNESIIEGIGISIIAFALVEIVVETLWGWTRELLELFRVNPNSPNLLELYYQIQVDKGILSIIVFICLLTLLKWKGNAEVNLWHVFSMIPSFLGYSIYIYFNYSHLFPVP